MYNTDLYENISKGNVQSSLYIASKILLTNEISIEIFENTLIAIISYIGSFINIYDVKKWLDIIKDTKNIIDDDNVNIKHIFILLTKMCILCDVYIKNPVTKTGVINLKSLRDKIIDVFSDENAKLSTNGIIRFKGVIPPSDSNSYNISLQIIAGIIKLINTTDDLSCDDGDKLQDISNKLRNCFDYIIRKKYTFETKFYSSDNDSSWFIWGILSILYNEEFIDNIFFLFSNNCKKTNKNYKMGLLWGTAIAIIYSHKKNVALFWNEKEQNIINKINEISLVLFKEIKTELFKNKDIKNLEEDANIKEKDSSIDGLEYLNTYIPTIRHSHHMNYNNNDDDNDNDNDNSGTKKINFKNRRDK